MAYCAPKGIPHSVFLGWDQADQDKALAWMLDQSKRCQGCGTYPDIWLDEDGREVIPPPMFVHSRQCLGCATLATEEKIANTGEAGERPPGITFYLSSEPPRVRDDDEDDLDDE